MAATFKKILSGSGKLIQIVTGTDGGRAAWHCVLVEKAELKNFMETVDGTSSVNVETFGRILESGWGDTPPQDVLDRLADEYM